jgi:hypothetical protein
LVGTIKLPMNWRRYDRYAARIEKEHPGVRSFPGGMATLFAVPAAHVRTARINPQIGDSEANPVRATAAFRPSPP